MLKQWETGLKYTNHFSVKEIEGKTEATDLTEFIR